MAYRLLALDLDGTLLRRDQVVDERDIAAITELRNAGVTITIVTGRLHSGSLAAARACSIEGPIACVEGSHVIDVATNRTIAHHAMTGESAALLRSTFGGHGLTSFVFDAAGIHHDHTAAPYAEYVSTWSPNLRVVEDELAWQTEPLAAVAIGDRDAIEAVHEVLRGHADRLFSVSFETWAYPGKHAVLVRAAGPSKATGLTEVCRAAGCTPADAVAVGDWFNDIPMFEIAGRSFAMADAPDAVRAAATEVLERQAGTGGGIAEAIRRAWG